MEVGQAHRPVVVGVDGSGSAYRAVEWAAAEAARRGAELRLVRAFSWTTSERPIRDDSRVAQYRDELLKIARGQVARAARIAADARPELETTTQVAIGAPIEVLGSVAVGLAAHGACPVVIVRGERGGPGNAESPVVVGIDDSSIGEAALAFAFDAAAARGVGLVVVHAWSPTAIDDALAPVMDWDAATAEEDALLAERLTGWGQKHPEVAVRRTVVREGAVRALVAASREAQLVVVGSRGRGNATGLLLGSVSHGVLHASHCPVAIVRSGTDS